MGNDALIECIDGIIKKSKIDHRLQPGDYLREDGLYCCHKCKTPKQVEIFILGRHEKPYCMCECESKQWDIDNTEDKQAKWELNRDRWLDGEIYKEWKFEVDDKKSIKMSNAMFRYVQKFEEMKEKNQGLLFCGDIGTGKSFFAAAIVNELISQGYQACMITTINAVNYMTSNKTKADVSEKWQKLFKNSDLVVFDELDGERDTSFMTEQIYKLIDDRLKTNKPFIVTTNKSLDDIKNIHDMSQKRIYDRVIQVCHPIIFDGVSRRREKANNNFRETNDLLGI